MESGKAERAPSAGLSSAEGQDQPVACKVVSLSPRPNFLAQLLFLFVSPIVRHARREGDVQPAQLFFPSAVLIDRVYGLFNAAWVKGLKAGKPNIVRAVVANSFWSLIWTGLLYTVSLGCQLVGPIVLQRIVSGLQCWGKPSAYGGHCPTEAHLYYYVIAITLAPLVQSLVENQMQYMLNVAGLKMRNGLMAAIYRKCLRLSNAALQSESTGRVVTLMSNDAQKVQDVMLAIHTLWGAPVLIVIILGLLYQQLGWATFVGLVVVVIYSPVSTKVSARLIGLRRSLMKFTDKRVGLMNEIINSMQFLKFYAWERPFQAAVMEVRDQEANILRRIIWWQALFIMLLFSGPVLMAVTVFAVYGATGHVFGPASAYTSLALFNLLRMPLAFLPIMITSCINALVALTRISDFLQKPESGLEALRKAAEGTPAGHVQIDKGVFTWESDGDASNAYMKDISFEAKPGTLTMVVGSVASGKSSLLSALIGQMERLQGTVAVGGRVAYVAQSAWIINESVQENIVMGEAFESSRYRVAAEVAQLLPDLAMWPAGDRTEIGDRGVTLSGGQKARVSIARAVYSDADTYLMDDPLAAVDTHVGRALFERCIRGVLRNKTVILVTNALQHLPSADNIIWMDNGRIRAQGKYQDLVAAGLNLSELHLEDRHAEGSSCDDSSSEFANSDDWEAAEPADSDDSDAAAVSPVGQAVQTVTSTMSSSSELPDEDNASSAASSSSCNTSASGQERQQPLHTDAASDVTSSGSGVATVMIRRGQPASPCVDGQLPSPAAVGDSGIPTGSVKPPAVTAVAGTSADFAGARSVSAAALRVASSKAAPPSSLSLKQLTADANRNLTGDEKKEKGSISSVVLRAYIGAAGGFLVALFVVGVMAAEQGSRVMTDTFLGWWASNLYHQTLWFYIAIYASLGVLYSLLTFVRVLALLRATVTASVVLHNKLLTHILRLPKSFFDTNPAGRVLNRFSRDIETMDSVLNQDISQFCNCFATYLATLIVISYATQWFGLAVVPITIVYVILQRYYIPTARELQRLESVTRSPIYSKFSEALAGVATIRAYRREAYFTAASDSLMELNAAAFVSQRAAAGWLALRLDLLGVVVILLTAVLSISGGITPALAGLCLVYALDMTRFLKYGTALAAKTESDFNSVERVVQYLSPPTEAAEETDPDVAAQLPKDWPSTGAISVRQLVLRYRPGLPLVLRGVSFDVAGGNKVGLVGRTGSGKSSLLLALFRMVEAESGCITIDGVDISKLGLRHLRSQMSIIPQEPFLFSGTVRSNLDPFNSYEEAELWRAVSAVGLKEAISALQAGLDAHVVDGGNNFSQGQKQLFCLARAILRNSRVLMLDEATASVDPETDGLIQRTIRTSFASTTMLTIAHRLNTIMDADRVLVLDQGMLVESGEPHDLLQNHQGIFSGMVTQTGPSSSSHLREVASLASFDRTASRTAVQMRPLQYLQPQLREQSEVLGRRYVDNPVQAGQQEGAEGGDPEVYRRTDSDLGRFGGQYPFLASAGGAYTRELSLLQRNTAAGDVGPVAGALLRHLPGMAEVVGAAPAGSEAAPAPTAASTGDAPGAAAGQHCAAEASADAKQL